MIRTLMFLVSLGVSLGSDPRALAAALQGPQRHLIWQLLQILVALNGSLIAALILLFTKDSRAWFASRTEARRQAKARPAQSGPSLGPQGISDDPELLRLLAEEEPGSVFCERCNGRLAKVDLGAGGKAVVGTAPLLYLGVVCVRCRKVECGPCRAQLPADAPCRWCGGPVRPAYEHHLR